MSYLTLTLVLLATLAWASLGEDTMFSGEKLLTDQFLENGPYKLIMQRDCNLVLYVKQDDKNKALWSTRTNGHGDSCTLVFQSNGNLVVFSGSDVLWSSSTPRGRNNYRLVMQGDGNLVVYGGPIWASNTAQSSRKSNMTTIIPHA